jgi:hypothetical protein
MIRSIAFAILIGLVASTAGLAADETIGWVSDVKSKAFVFRDGQQLVPEAGFKLKTNDTLRTDSGGAIGVIFNDETVLSLGPDSELTVDEFVFNPDQSRFSFVAKMIRGTAVYISGLITKINPESARFVTPSASIGIRGTKMLIQVENDKGTL